ncbi:MAG: ribonuclease HII [Nanobdellota archaeon]
MNVLGIDEAGRGPVVGPMVMAGCILNDNQIKKLKEIGVKDSKLVAKKKRENIFNIIKENCINYEIIILTPDEIDSREKRNISLNTLEANASAEIVATLWSKTDGNFKTILDSPSNNPGAYSSLVLQRTKNLDNSFEGNIIAEIKADMNYVPVSAASILAKVTRDKLVEDMKEKAKSIVGDKEIGSGYPSDPKTKEFIKKYWNRFDDFKGGFFRKSWNTWKAFKKKDKQKDFKGYFKK